MIVERIQRVLRRHGLLGAARLAGEKARRTVYLRETHIWWRKDLAGEPVELRLAPGLHLVDPAAAGDLRLLDPLPMGGPHGVARRLEANARPWIVVDGPRAVFGCWVFADRALIAAARGGAIPLPAGTAYVDDVVTVSDYRGRGIAPAALAAIAARLRDEGVSGMVSKIEEHNVASMRAFERAGFRSVARMSSMRVGPLARLRVEPGADDFASFLAARCNEGSRPRRIA